MNDDGKYMIAIKLKKKQLIDSYNQFIVLIAKLVHELALSNNSISYSFIISKLIHKSLISYRNIFYNLKGNKYADECFGIDVINGYLNYKGVSTIHQDILNCLKTKGIVVQCLLSKESNLDSVYNMAANHAVNLIEYNDIFYVHDVLNRIFYRIEDNNIMIPYTIIPPYNDMLYYKDKVEIFSPDKQCITRKQLNEVLIETTCNYDKNKRKLKYFSYNAKPYMEEIVSLSKNIRH